ncbi:histone deacetylase family protein [Nitzschia inconspicua]|uniref:histone deacetylase n=1 Tax=Nitzschia inconspicua TaxID=303405 RepID=A0A9K3P9S7_9STRA|nr:histone deacetylase family protein [Nitzschia inconspicua]
MDPSPLDDGQPNPGAMEVVQQVQDATSDGNAAVVPTTTEAVAAAAAASVVLNPPTKSSPNHDDKEKIDGSVVKRKQQDSDVVKEKPDELAVETPAAKKPKIESTADNAAVVESVGQPETTRVAGTSENFKAQTSTEPEPILSTETTDIAESSSVPKSTSKAEENSNDHITTMNGNSTVHQDGAAPGGLSALENTGSVEGTPSCQAVESSAKNKMGSVDQKDDSEISNVDDKGRQSSNEGEESLGNTITGDVVEHYIKLDPLVSRSRPLKSLSKSELAELEKLFGIDKGINRWDDDWVGVVALAEEDVPNPDAKAGEKSKAKPLATWAERGKKSLKLLFNLLRHVYNHKKTPKQAKKILGNADPSSFTSLNEAIGRLSIDPLVLRQDGWTTTKADQPEGASGGAYRIGEKVIWQGYVAVVIAFVHDPHIGDLFKAMWTEDLSTFDLELEELEDAKRKYNRKQQGKAQAKERKGSKDLGALDARRSVRTASTADFHVKGIEHGIVLATSYAKGARHGVFWPARILHATEVKSSPTKRNNRQKVDVVFLAPYWNSNPLTAASGRRAEAFFDSIAKHGDALFRSGPLFEFESIDANEESIQRYPYDADTGLDIDELRSSFKFSGLPKAVFARFLDSHRLALALKTYSQNEMKSTCASDIDRASADLLEGHPLSALTANFPEAVLHLPFDHILSQLPHPEQEISSLASVQDVTANEEPPLQLGRILDSMKPPMSWGLEGNVRSSTVKESPGVMNSSTPISFDAINGNKEDLHDMDKFLAGLGSLQAVLTGDSRISVMLKGIIEALLSSVPSSAIQQFQNDEKKRKLVSSIYKKWIVVKGQGEELISSLKEEKSLKEWRRFCERIYKCIVSRQNTNGENGSGFSRVITDSRCNLHLTSSECFERPVRLPAAMKAVRQVTGNIQVFDSVDDRFLELAENDIIRRAHQKSYIQRFKKRCLAATQETIIPLTEDSDGNGGEDTKGSKGSWKAAVAAVGAALQGAEMIMNGDCVNVFCPTRPPGHHAGRELHAMKAVSNGFCVLNAVACAALYATAPLSDGGLGLSRVCVIDIDVHHGNGEVGEQMSHHLGRNPKKGIFPGRCGDTSPHRGVLNIPLGAKVTSHALGTALITRVSPAVEKFAPELIIVSAGFDAHKNDPLNLGGLSADDFGTLTEIICKLAFKSCSGRVLSVLEGGYGVPCCRPQQFPNTDEVTSTTDQGTQKSQGSSQAISGASEGEASNTPPEDVQSSNAPEPGLAGTADATRLLSTAEEPEVPLQCLDLGEELPPNMPDVVSSYALQKRLDRCHAEGFIHCVQEHVSALVRCNNPTNV